MKHLITIARRVEQQDVALLVTETDISIKNGRKFGEVGRFV